MRLSRCLLAALTSRKGLVAPVDLVEALDRGIKQPQLPDWIQQWSRAEEMRPWPPMSEETPQVDLTAAE